MREQRERMGSVQSKYLINYDPYHMCVEWRSCCKANYQRLQVKPHYIENFGNNTKKQAHLKYRKGIFTYRKWLWFEEIFFEDLPQPSQMNYTDCGVCICCARKKTPCLAPQHPGTYTRWYTKKKNEFLEL